MILSPETTLQNTYTFAVNNFRQLKEKLLNWLQQFDSFSFLDNHQYHFTPHTQECLIAVGAKRKLQVQPGNALEPLQAFINQSKGKWLFGHLNYDLKNEIENLSSHHEDHIGFPDTFFFEPEIVIRLGENEIGITHPDAKNILATIEATPIKDIELRDHPVAVKSRITKKEYIEVIELLKAHILKGDAYEINFCLEFFAEHAAINPFKVYEALSALSPNPFSGFYRVEDKWLLCASPERFLKREGDRLLSQPMKGTSRRVNGNSEKDFESKEALFNSGKDRSENVMVVDVVRNDLARICKEGTVQVDELYGIYSFPQVHQMVSTISGIIRPDVSFTEIIRAVFPMGSMTGAPKKKVMELIEQYETTRRGIFSGAIGYIDPNGDFDFNVVIRSIMYNSTSQYLSYLAGSGITFYSDAEQEWEECLLKAEAMTKVIQQAGL